MVDSGTIFTAVIPLEGIPDLNKADSVALSIVPGLAYAQLFAKQGKESELCERLDIDEQPGRSTVLERYTALPLSPGQWMLMTTPGCGDDSSLVTALSDRVAGIGYLSEQRDARVCVRLSGFRARNVMAKGCRLDLHPRVATPGFCAQTMMAQVGVILHHVDDIPTYDMLVFSGFARSFWEWIAEAAGEYLV